MKISLSVLSILAGVVLLLISCSKSDSAGDVVNPPQPSVIDSSKIIKSITVRSFDFASGVPSSDSVIETYDYDSLNRRIVLSWSGYSSQSDDPVGAKITLSYNTDWRLSGVSWNYPQNYVTNPWDYSTIALAYDNEGVLKRAEVRYTDQKFRAIDFIKQPKSNGYSLSWYEFFHDAGSPDFDVNDTTWRIASFDNLGRCITNSSLEQHMGNTIVDSLVYDQSGNVSKNYSFNSATNTTIIQENYTSRLTTGTELYNFRNSLYKGISNIPFISSDILGQGYGVLSVSKNYDFPQYTKTAFTSVVVFDYFHKSYVNFNVSPELDSMGRLKKCFRFWMDFELMPLYLKIEYFK